MKLALVTGGAGFIGSHLVRGLLDESWRVRVLDDLSSGHQRNLDEIAARIEFIKGDICDFQTARRCCTGVDTVFHVAARGSVPRSIDEPRVTNEVNITGTLNMLVAAREASARRFVYSASSSAYGDTPTLPKSEDMAPRPLSPYAVSKLAAEQYCSVFAGVYGLQTVSMRYFNVFGPRQDPESAYAAVIPAFVSRMLSSQRPIIYGDGEQTRDFCFVENVVSANLLAARAEKLAGEVVNIACGERVSLNEIVKLLNGALGTQLTPEYRPARLGDVKHSLAALEAARAVIGYVPRVRFGEGLQRSIEWYRQYARR
ncbi:MAG: SDR family oxidoreductase [Phycisphaerae bacterium]